MMHVFQAILGATATAKVAYASVGTLAVTAGGWVTILAQEGGGSDPVATLIPAAALTGTSAALVWVVKQIVGGNLVHRDPASAAAKLTEALTRSNELAVKSIEREKILTDMLRGGARGTK